MWRPSLRSLYQTVLACVLLAVLLAVPGMAFADESDTQDVIPTSMVAGQLEMTVPDEITLGILPIKLEVGFDPSVIQTGYDCGMADMCGLDPCLCGIPDSYGACACNGEHDTLPALAVTPSNTDVVLVVGIGQDRWLVPVGAGDSELRIDGALPHYGTTTAKVAVHVETLLPPPVIYVLGLLVLIALIMVVCIVVLRRGRGGRGSRGGRGGKSDKGGKGTAALVSLLICTLLALPLLAGCSGAVVNVTDNSPRVINTSVASFGNGTEAGQKVEVRIVFNALLVSKGNVLDDLTITLNDEAIDNKAITVGAVLAGDTTLLISLTPAAGTGATNSPHYFALYEGRLAVKAKDSSGGLAHLTAAGADASAVITTTLSFRIPSGIVIEVIDSVAGDIATTAPAQVSLRIVTLPRLRVITWVSVKPDGEASIVHNHDFTTYKDDAASRARYAAHMADSLKNYLDSNYSVTSKDDVVTITARTVTDGQVITPTIVEGVDK